MLALFAVMIPSDILNGLPNLVTYFVSSGTAVGAIGALILNLVLPQKKEESQAIQSGGEINYATR